MQGVLYEWMGVPKRATCPPTTAGAFIQKPWLHHTLSSSSSMVGDSVRQESGVELAKVECRSQGHRSGRGCGCAELLLLLLLRLIASYTLQMCASFSSAFITVCT